jgi:2-polyprenyl-6-methoxyphenol hydroxylase-like FAD-dependent oxidoreductase
MPANVVVLAHRTAAAPELVTALRARQEKGAIHATLVIPADGSRSADRDAAKERLEAALAAWRDAGIDCDGVVGDCIPLQALADAWDPARHDEVIVSTLPGQSSKWIRWDLPHLASRQTGVSVKHVIARDPAEAAEPHAGPPPRRERSPLGPFTYSGAHSSSRLPNGSSV